MFVLFDDRVSLDVTFQIGSVVETVVGLRDVRYFAFSRKTVAPCTRLHQRTRLGLSQGMNVRFPRSWVLGTIFDPG